jgi:hypothetical protein
MSSVANWINELIHTAATADSEITVSSDQVHQVIASLPRGKAVGPDKLSYEHLSFGPAELISSTLSTLFNGILSSSYAPKSFCLSYIIPIPKSGKALDFSNPTNYRGISLSSSLSKVFEKVLMITLNEILSPRIHSLQGGFRVGYSTSHTSFLVTEGLLHCKDNHRKAYLALLDARKAFDTVWHDALFVKLSEYGVTGKLWLVLYNWYSKLRATVTWNGSVSSEFEIKQGVRQGAICSPIFYAVYINDLLISLEEQQLGLYVDRVYPIICR